MLLFQPNNLGYTVINNLYFVKKRQLQVPLKWELSSSKLKTSGFGAEPRGQVSPQIRSLHRDLGVTRKPADFQTLVFC